MQDALNSFKAMIFNRLSDLENLVKTYRNTSKKYYVDLIELEKLRIEIDKRIAEHSIKEEMQFKEFRDNIENKADFLERKIKGITH